MELGWNDVENTFEAWITTGSTPHFLIRGTMSESLAVFGVGLEMTGTQSYATQFLAAVPEPAAAVHALGALLCLTVACRRRRMVTVI